MYLDSGPEKEYLPRTTMPPLEGDLALGTLPHTRTKQCPAFQELLFWSGEANRGDRGYGKQASRLRQIGVEVRTCSARAGGKMMRISGARQSLQALVKTGFHPERASH